MANAAATGREARISAPQSRIEAWIIPIDEAQVLAQAAIAAQTKWSHKADDAKS